MEIVTLAIVCKDGDGEFIANELISSDTAQTGLICRGTSIRKAPKKEAEEVHKQMD